jgi:hypothetical protein
VQKCQQHFSRTPSVTLTKLLHILCPAHTPHLKAKVCPVCCGSMGCACMWQKRCIVSIFSLISSSVDQGDRTGGNLRVQTRDNQTTVACARANA